MTGLYGMNLRFNFLILLTGLFVSQFAYTFPFGIVIPSEKTSLLELSPASNQELPKKFKVVVWNAAKGGYPGWTRDIRSLVRASHLILLQEAYLSGPMEKVLTQNHKFGWNMAVSFLRNSIATGVATGSVAQPVELKMQRSPVYEPVIGTPKVCLFDQYELEDAMDSLLVVNCHGINFRSAHSLKIQLEEMEKEIMAHGGPVLVGGDFNTWSTKKIKVLNEIMYRNDLVIVKWQNPRDKLFRGIFDLDHIFVRELEVGRRKILKNIDSSDHRPLFIEITAQK